MSDRLSMSFRTATFRVSHDNLPKFPAMVTWVEGTTFFAASSVPIKFLQDEHLSVEEVEALVAKVIQVGVADWEYEVSRLCYTLLITKSLLTDEAEELSSSGIIHLPLPIKAT